MLWFFKRNIVIAKLVQQSIHSHIATSCVGLDDSRVKFVDEITCIKPYNANLRFNFGSLNSLHYSEHLLSAFVFMIGSSSSHTNCLSSCLSVVSFRWHGLVQGLPRLGGHCSLRSSQSVRRISQSHESEKCYSNLALLVSLKR